MLSVIALAGVGVLTAVSVYLAETPPNPAPNRERQADNEARVTYWRPM